MGARWWLGVTGALVALGCHRGGAERAGRTQELAACAAAIERVPELRPDARLLALARGCAPACAGLASWADAIEARDTPRASWRRQWLDTPPPPPVGDPAIAALLDGCGARCAAGALGAGTPGQLWSAAVARCGPQVLGLPAARARLASVDWLVLARITAWIDRERRLPVDDPQLGAELERATLRAQLRLPLPARDDAAHYALVASASGHPTEAALYLVITSDGVRAGAVPEVRLRGPELELRAGPGADFPGQRVDEGQVAQVFAEQAAIVERDARGAGARPPLLVIDGAVPLPRVIELFTALGVPRAEVAVAGASALAHGVVLERPTRETQAVPTVEIGPDAIRIAGYSDDRLTTWTGLADELGHFAAVNAPVRRIGLVLQAPATAADLVRILDACAEAHVASLVVAPAP